VVPVVLTRGAAAAGRIVAMRSYLLILALLAPGCGRFGFSTTRQEQAGDARVDDASTRQDATGNRDDSGTGSLPWLDGSPADASSPDAPPATGPQDCGGGIPCECPPGQDCQFRCIASPCVLRCSAGSTCTIDCPSHSCSTQCTGSGTRCTYCCGSGVMCSSSCSSGASCGGTSGC
jgi:hypothetical protein